MAISKFFDLGHSTLSQATDLLEDVVQMIEFE